MYLYTSDGVLKAQWPLTKTCFVALFVAFIFSFYIAVNHSTKAICICINICTYLHTNYLLHTYFHICLYFSHIDIFRGRHTFAHIQVLFLLFPFL